MELYEQHPSPTDLDDALGDLELALAGLAAKDKIILSDFDHTLCDTYSFNPTTNNHLASIDPAVVEAAQPHHLVVATSRRVSNPTVPVLWSSGLVHPDVPVIAENGGVILYPTNDGLTCVDMIDPESMQSLQTVRDNIQQEVAAVPTGQQLTFKQGRTLLIARLQDEHGNSQPKHQAWLAERLQQLVDDPSLCVVDTRASVTIQHKEVSKGRAFRHYLQLANILRDEVCIIGMGDGLNDRQLFEEADVSLGFSDVVRPLVDVSIPGGPRAIPHVLRVIETATTLATSWR